MQTKSDDLEHRSGRAESDSDTASYEQLQGTPDRRDVRDKPDPKMPHERDESARSSGERSSESRPPPDQQIVQAHDDVERGLIDTDRRGTPDDIPRSVHDRKS